MSSTTSAHPYLPDPDEVPESRSPADTAYEQQPESLLDRAWTIGPWSLAWAGGALLLVIAVFTRLAGLDRQPLGPREGELALQAHQLINGTFSDDHLAGAATTVDTVALGIFLGGSFDSVVRLAVASAAILSVILAFLFVRGLNRWAALPALALVTLSPTLISAGRRLDGGALLVLLSLAIGIAVTEAIRSESDGWHVLSGAATGALLIADPLGPIAALLVWVAIILLYGVRVPQNRSLLLGAVSGAATIVLLTTSLLTRPTGLFSSLGETFAQLWSLHLSDLMANPLLPLINVLLNEPLLLLLAVYAVVAAPQRGLVRAFGGWALLAFVVVSLLDGVGPAAQVLLVLPLALLAGLGLATVYASIPLRSFATGTGVVYVGALVLLLAAAVSLFGLVIGGVGDDRIEWLLEFALIVLVAILPLTFALSAAGQRLVGHRRILVLATCALLLSLLTIRSSVLAASERAADPADPLSVGASSPAVGALLERTMRISRDLTVDERTSQDPTGGHGLHIALDEDIEFPFRWYFRDFPNVQIFDAEVGIIDQSALDIVFLSNEHSAEDLFPGLASQTYPLLPTQAGVFTDPDYGDLIADLFSIDGPRRFVEFSIQRRLLADPADELFQYVASPRVANLLFQDLGPYTLYDRPGAGSANGQFNQPRGIAVGLDGTTYVVDSRNARIQVFAPDGSYLSSFGSQGTGQGQFAVVAVTSGGGPAAIAIGDDGNLCVTDTWNHRVQVFSPDGTFLRAWGSFYDAANDPAATAENAGLFYGPRGIAFHDGLLYVTDTGNERVQVFTPEGAIVRMFGAPGAELGQLTEPVGIAVTSDGTVLVADSHNARIARFTPDGKPLEPWAVPDWQGQQFFEPYLAIDAEDRVYATSSFLGVIEPLSADGVVSGGLGIGVLRQPVGITVGLDGSTLLVSDVSQHAIVAIPLPAE